MQVEDKIIKNWTQLIYYQLMKNRRDEEKNTFSARDVGGKCLNSLKIFKLKKNHTLRMVNYITKRFARKIFG